MEIKPRSWKKKTKLKLAARRYKTRHDSKRTCRGGRGRFGGFPWRVTRANDKRVRQSSRIRGTWIIGRIRRLNNWQISAKDKKWQLARERDSIIIYLLVTNAKMIWWRLPPPHRGLDRESRRHLTRKSTFSFLYFSWYSYIMSNMKKLIKNNYDFS